MTEHRLPYHTGPGSPFVERGAWGPERTPSPVDDCAQPGCGKKAMHNSDCTPSPDAPRSERRDVVSEKLDEDPDYRPYCLRCTTMARMKPVEPRFFRCSCGNVADYRSAPLPSDGDEGERDTNNYHDAYRGAREDLLYWKRRALIAEAALRAPLPVEERERLEEAATLLRAARTALDTGDHLYPAWVQRTDVLLAALRPVPPEQQERERQGWAVERGVVCVVCPACAFTFDATHEDEGGGYTCPSCAPSPEVQHAPTEGEG